MNIVFAYKGIRYTAASALESIAWREKEIKNAVLDVRTMSSIAVAIAALVVVSLIKSPFEVIENQGYTDLILADLLLLLGCGLSWYFFSRWFITADEVRKARRLNAERDEFIRVFMDETRSTFKRAYGLYVADDALYAIATRGGAEFPVQDVSLGATIGYSTFHLVDDRLVTMFRTTDSEVAYELRPRQAA